MMKEDAMENWESKKIKKNCEYITTQVKEKMRSEGWKIGRLEAHMLRH